jgi:hypothetical protein
MEEVMMHTLAHIAARISTGIGIVLWLLALSIGLYLHVALHFSEGAVLQTGYERTFIPREEIKPCWELPLVIAAAGLIWLLIGVGLRAL